MRITESRDGHGHTVVVLQDQGRTCRVRWDDYASPSTPWIVDTRVAGEWLTQGAWHLRREAMEAAELELRGERHG